MNIKTLIQKLLGRSDIWIDGKLYMLRWKFVPDWLPGFRVHKILISDKGPELHDHPFGFITFILKGGYHEHLIDGSKTYHKAPAMLFRPAKTMHRIELAKASTCTQYDARAAGGCGPDELPAWTFVLRTRYYREWGFMMKGGWLHWRKYDAMKLRKA